MKRALKYSALICLLLTAPANLQCAEAPPAQNNRVAEKEFAIRRKANLKEADIHFRRGRALTEKSQHNEAIRHFQRALAIFHEFKDRAGEAVALNNIGAAYDSLSRYEEELKYHKQALSICREVEYRQGEGETLYSMGLACFNLGRYAEALKHYEQALPIFREIKDSQREGDTLYSIGFACGSQKHDAEALNYYTEALAIFRAVKDRQGEANSLRYLGASCENLSRYEEALKYYEQALPIFREVKDRKGEASTLSWIGSACDNLSRYEEALKYYEQALPIFRDIKDPEGEADTLNFIGLTDDHLNQHEQAQKCYGQALLIFRQRKNKKDEAMVLSNIGLAYDNLGRYQEALKYYERALPMRREVKDTEGEAVTLINIAGAYEHLGRHKESVKYLKQALPICRGSEDRLVEAAVLNDIGLAYQGDGDPEEALKYFEHALRIVREIKNRAGEASTLSGMMWLWKSQNNPRLAIFYGKQAVNTYQEIRGNIRGLNREMQTGFLKSHTDPYRDLSDLLISQGRLPEAQQVLGLLKEEEYFDFVRRDRSVADSLSGRAALTPAETDWEQRYREIADRVTAIGTEYGELVARKSRTTYEQQRISALEKDLQVANQAFQKFLDQLEKEATQSTLSPDKVNQVREAQGLISDLKELGSGAVALYTLVGEEKYRVILVTPDVEKAAEYPIKAAELNRKVLAFREALQDPGQNPLQAAQELYRILVAPVAKDLNEANAQTLMWSLDGTLRYIPMAALHDGEKYLAERYRNVVFTPASNARLKDPVRASWNALGLGVSKAHEGFSALQGVVSELKGIIRTDRAGETEGVLRGARKLDEEFTEREIMALGSQYPLVHIASHFQFKPGTERDSFLLLGDGTHLTLDRIKSLPNVFRGVELLTLSACNTATGGTGADGKEVEGFAVLSQRQGAKAVIATLWPVDDESTALLMREFYRLRQDKPGTVKSEALRQAQLELLYGQVKSNDSNRGRSATLTASHNSFIADPKAPFAHPYYWAPFILIGNWR